MKQFIVFWTPSPHSMVHRAFNHRWSPRWSPHHYRILISFMTDLVSWDGDKAGGAVDRVGNMECWDGIGKCPICCGGVGEGGGVDEDDILKSLQSNTVLPCPVSLLVGDVFSSSVLRRFMAFKNWSCMFV